MSVFRDHGKTKTEERRLLILQTLTAAEGYRANESVLQSSLDLTGYMISADRLAGDLSWLEEQALIDVEIIGGDIRIATVLERGADVAAGRVTHPGVKRPRPKR